jgi:hypothetical protein
VTAVRYGGIIHCFVMLNALHSMHDALAAIAQATAVLRALSCTTRRRTTQSRCCRWNESRLSVRRCRHGRLVLAHCAVIDRLFRREG